MLNAQWLMLNARDRCVSTDIELQRGVVRSKAPQTAAAMWQLIKLIAKKINMLIWGAGIEKQKAKAETQNQLATMTNNELWHRYGYYYYHYYYYYAYSRPCRRVPSHLQWCNSFYLDFGFLSFLSFFLLVFAACLYSWKRII